MKNIHPKAAEYFSYIEKFLIEKYGEIKNQWLPELDDYKEMLHELYTYQDIINEEGYVVNNRCHPLLKRKDILRDQLLKKAKSFGFNPYAESRVKITLEDQTDDFIDALTR